MEQSVFVKTNAVIAKLKNILKCQLCSELKNHNLVFYYKSCGHFYCSECHESNSCAICINKEDVPFKLINDKNLLSLYESVLNLKLPPRNNLKSIIDSCQSSILDSLSDKNAKVCNEIEPSQTILNTKKEKQSSNNLKSDISHDKTEILKAIRTSLNDNTEQFPKVNHETPIKTKQVASGNDKVSTSKKKIDINKRNHKGETRLHLACKKGDLSEIKNLIDAGADVNAQDAAGWTPLHDSVNNCNLSVIRLLLLNGAKINTPGLENNTPLHVAVTNNNDKVCELLMRFGADPKSKDITGETPLDLAKSYGYLEVQNTILCTRPTEKLNSEFEKSKSEKFIVIWKHLLTATEEEAVKQFGRQFNADIIVDIYPFCSRKEVTHIIVSCDGKITLNWAILSSVLSGAWLVDSRWIIDSLNDKTVKSVKDYTLQDEFFSGFERSRLSKINQLPGLFSGCHFFFHGTIVNYYVGKIKIMKDHLSSLVKKNGGIILKRSPDPESPALELTVPFHATENSSIAATSYFIIYQSGKNEPVLKYNMSHVKTLPVDWLILCIFNFRLIDPADTENLLKKFLQE